MFGEWVLAVAGVAAASIFLWVVNIVRDLWWRPLQIYKRLHAQGVQGPPFRAVVGNQPEYARMLAAAASSRIKLSSHEIVPHVLPYYKTWSKIYGDMFTYAYGSEVRLTITDPELMKEILSNKFGHFPKVTPNSASRDLLGENSLLLARGEKWAQERRILNHGFHVDKLKAMVETMAELTTKMLNDWERKIVAAKQSKHAEIEVREQYQNLTADIISHTAFGSSYEAGKKVFQLQYLQADMVRELSQSIRFPGRSLFRITKYLRRRKIRKTIEENLQEIVRKRLQQTPESDLQHDDLLGVMVCAYKGQLLGNQKNWRMSIQDIVDECKTFYFAGHETTTSLLTWTTMLLALHPSWQERVRAEVMSVCGRNNPTGDMLTQLKLMGNVMNETLRLYSPVLGLRRCTDRDMKLGKQQLLIPKGTVLSLLLIVMLHDKKMWGEDADTFNPDRFAEGVANASKHPSAFMPFSMGPRNCIGQVFAQMEAKVVLCKLLQRFSFELSTEYVHSPSHVGLLRPTFGMQILATPIHR